MTCIVGIIDKLNKKVIIGADSAAINNNNITIRKDEKVFKNNEFIIGCTSSFRMIQLLKYSFIPPPINNKDIFEYMCTDFINEVKKCFKNGGYLQNYEAGDDLGGVFLVGYKDRLFKIDYDFQVAETIRGYDACGIGECYAISSIYNNKDNNSKNKILKALETAEYFSAAVHKPFIIYST